ncbi:MAG: hypothetical protein KDB90_00855 [Planctomycetes bacterium]|nr:hypothetical protein [Planctomycetota bacterium]
MRLLALTFLLCAAPCAAQVVVNGTLDKQRALYIFDLDFGATAQSVALTADVTLTAGGQLEVELFDLDGAAAQTTAVRQSALDFSSDTTGTVSGNAVATINTRSYNGVHQFLMILFDGDLGADYDGTVRVSTGIITQIWQLTDPGRDYSNRDLFWTPRSVHMWGDFYSRFNHLARFGTDFGSSGQVLDFHFEWYGQSVGGVGVRDPQFNTIYSNNTAPTALADGGTVVGCGFMSGLNTFTIAGGATTLHPAPGEFVQLDAFLPSGFAVVSADTDDQPLGTSGPKPGSSCSAHDTGFGSLLGLLAVLCLSSWRRRVNLAATPSRGR